MRYGILSGRRAVAVGVLAVGLFVAERPAAAAPPQTTMGSRFNTGSDSFFENVGVGFGFSIPSSMPGGHGSGVVGFSPTGGAGGNINFNAGGGGAATPLGLGGSTPGATLGFAVKTPLGTAFFNLSASQGSDRSQVSQGGSLTVINGGTGFVSDTSQRPFVTSVVPVVGDNDAAPGDEVGVVSTPLSSFNSNPSVLGERLGRLNSGDVGGPRRGAAHVPVPNLLAPADPAGPAKNSASAATGSARASDPFRNKLAAASASSAGQPTASVSEIRAQLAAEDAAAEAEWREALEAAQQALDAGKPNVARIYYQQVIRRGSGLLKQQALDGLKALSLDAGRFRIESMSDAPQVLASGRFLRLVAQAHWEYAERITASGAVAIVAITDSRRLVLVEQFRIPLGCSVIELPAGLAGDVPEDAAVDPAIALANAARRELLEETGYEAKALRRLADGPTSPGLTNETVTFFHATGLRRTHAGGGDEHEAITVHEQPLDELDDWLAARAAAGAAIDPKIYAGLYLVRQCLITNDE